MCACARLGRRWPWLTAVILLSFGVGGASAQDVLRVYGAEGPSPAINEAAVAFQATKGVKVEIISGPVNDWIEQAKRDADVIYSSGEFMMTEFIRIPELGIAESAVTPLYLRPSAILVRPGNPKEIHDFPDLLVPGVRVMVVNGSGQVGLWEDMAGKQGDIRTIRAFRKNIACFARSSDEAVRTWKERSEIDAWLTWNIWHIPLRNEAKLIPVSNNYVIYRQCSAALTGRGQRKPAAVDFVEFLTSSEGEEIFGSWAWMTAPAKESPLTVKTDICVVCRVKDDLWKDGVGLGFSCLRGLVADYREAGIAPTEVHISAVFHGPAARWLLSDTAYRAQTPGKAENPNKAIIRELLDLGVSLELCGQTMKEQGWTEKDVLSGVKIVVGAYPRIVDLELQGYAYLRF